MFCVLKVFLSAVHILCERKCGGIKLFECLIWSKYFVIGQRRLIFELESITINCAKISNLYFSKSLI